MPAMNHMQLMAAIERAEERWRAAQRPDLDRQEGGDLIPRVFLGYDVDTACLEGHVYREAMVHAAEGHDPDLLCGMQLTGVLLGLMLADEIAKAGP
jgi:hypothetical protein